MFVTVHNNTVYYHLTDRDALDQYYEFITCDFNHIIITQKKNSSCNKNETGINSFPFCLCVNQDLKNDRGREKRSVCTHKSPDMLCYCMSKLNTYIM